MYDTPGGAQVVLEHVVLAVAVPHDVHAGDMRVDAAGHVDAHHLGPVLGVVQDLLGRDHAGLDDLLPVIDVVDEAVERRDALDQAFFHRGPFVRRDDPRQQVEGDQALGAGAVLVFRAIDGKGDAHPPKDQFGFLAPRPHHLAGLPGEPLVVTLVVAPDRRAVVGQLFVHLIEFVHGTTNLLGHSLASSRPNPGGE